MPGQDDRGRRRGRLSDDVVESPRALSRDAAFKALGNETRLTILDTLWGPGTRAPMAFAELRKAVGMRDGSQFNYHLRKLLDGGFIARVDGRYVIRQAGARVIWSIRTGYLTGHPVIEPFETTGRCYACDAALHARYDDGMFVVECTACGQVHSSGWFPPNALAGRTPEEALLVHEYLLRMAIETAQAGICPVCNGPTDRTLARNWAEVPVGTVHLDADNASALGAWYVCRHCTAWANIMPGVAVIDHPAVVALYRAHGIDVLACPRWELPWTNDESLQEVVSEDPFRVQVTVTLAGETRVLTLDEAFDVVAVE